MNTTNHPIRRSLFFLILLTMLLLTSFNGTNFAFAQQATESAQLAKEKIDCVSPDGNVLVQLLTDAEGQLSYRIQWLGQPVIETSALGITVDGVALGSGVTLGKQAVSKHTETYTTRGVHKTAHDRDHRYEIPITHKNSQRTYSIEFRIFDDGVGYRYRVSGNGLQHVDGEQSSWRLTEKSTAWYFERLTKKWKLKSYAGEWLATDVEHLESVSPVGPIQGTPLVVQLPNQQGFTVATKAATYNYSGMRLKAVGNRTVQANFTEGKAGFDVQGSITTPWRVTMLAKDLNDLVNSDLIKNLNPAPDKELFADTSYIRPGRTAWSWETISLGTPEDQREFIDWAAKMEFEYSTIDDGWKDWKNPWQTVTQLSDYARQKNVGVWLWVDSKNIRDPSDNYRVMRDYFAKVAKTGAIGLKIDFMNGETKALVDFEIAVLQNAAKSRLMINFHGCHASTGEERTYPNEMTREGIRGIEVNKMKEGPLPASHNAALPFTRFLVGHADYTPVLFSNPGPTTWAHQVATLVQFTSALQTYAEDPQMMVEHEILGPIFPVLQSIPPIWDETRVLPGSEIGKLSVFARRNGDTWFVGILNGQDLATEYQLDLSFLPAGDYQAELVVDDTDADRVNLVGLNAKADLHEFTTTIPCKLVTQQVAADQEIKVQLAPGGGFVARLKQRTK